MSPDTAKDLSEVSLFVQLVFDSGPTGASVRLMTEVGSTSGIRADLCVV